MIRKRTYEEAMHAVQSGIAMEIELGINTDATPKHLRVGVNSALVDSGALTSLLIAKGIFTHEEFIESLTAAANREAERYEEKLSTWLGKTVTLG